MKIMILGSMTFAKDMLRAKEELEKLGHVAEVPFDVEQHTGDGALIDDLERNFQYCVEHDVMGKSFEQVAQSEAILVLNYPKNETEGYIGTSALMEMGLAHFLKKKIFVLHDIPDHKAHRWAHEVKIMQPVVLNGDFSRIS
jgi:hypothetical protein